MKLLVAKLGSKARPRSPRSPEELTVTVRNGAGSSAPFLITRNWPACRQTNRRPSGAKSMAVGLLRPLAISVSLKPFGSVAAAPSRQTAADIAAAIIVGKRKSRNFLLIVRTMAHPVIRVLQTLT